MKIALLSPTLVCGGAERVAILLATEFSQRGHDVSIVTLSSPDTDFYAVPTGVSRVSLDVMGDSKNLLEALWNNLLRIRQLRQTVTTLNPDVVISFIAENNVLTLVSLLGSGYPVIVTEHSDPRVVSCSKTWKFLRRLSYPFSAKLISVCQIVDSYFNWLSAAQKGIIYNPFLPVADCNQVIPLPEGVDRNKSWLVSMGRLSQEKGFDQLLKAFHKISPQHPDWQLIILGDGKMRAALEQLRSDLDLTQQVFLPGAISPPFPFLKQCQLFVSASRSEAFPMAQGEAMACGLPVISTDCGGPREIIRDGIDGILVPNHDVDALAVAMHTLMSDEATRQQLAANAISITERFSVEAIMSQWDMLLEEITPNYFHSITTETA